MSGEWRFAGRSRVTAAFAVQLRDAVTGERPPGTHRVRFAGSHEPFRVTRGGYHVAAALPDPGAGAGGENPAAVTVVVEPDGPYFETRETVSLEELEDRQPVATITVPPSPAYRLPADVTRLRGSVVDGDEPLEGVAVSVGPATADPDDEDAFEDAQLARSHTVADGEFLLALGWPGDDVVTTGSDGARLVRPDGADPDLSVRRSDGSLATTSVVVEEGALTSVRFDVSSQ